MTRTGWRVRLAEQIQKVMGFSCARGPSGKTVLENLKAEIPAGRLTAIMVSTVSTVTIRWPGATLIDARSRDLAGTVGGW